MRSCIASARRVWLMVCLWLATPAGADPIVFARYDGPTTRYAHAVLGDGIEHEVLVLGLASGDTARFQLPETSVFEDTAPRLADLDGDGAPEVIVVESDYAQGARLAIYTSQGRIAATPYIGTRFRWLAPVGAADLDGDGAVELAYVDRPHLAKVLRVWRFEAGGLTEVAALPGVTNHRIGEPDIAGGIRTCAGAPQMIVAAGNWSELLAVTFEAGSLSAEPIGTDTRRDAFTKAMACR